MTHTPKGLATVALLKTRLDEGHDHLALFEPLILDALLRLPAQDFVAPDVEVIVHERTGVLLPANAIQTLLGRCARRKLVERRGGRFFRTSVPFTDPRLDDARATHLGQQAALGQAFLEYAAERGLQLRGADEALAALATFVSDNKVHLILEDALSDSPLERSSLDRKLTRLVARFIAERCLQSPEMRPPLEALTEGILLQDVLLLRDIPEAVERFKDLMVFLDTRILFAAIDLAGVANGVAAKEGLTLLREAGARTMAFSRTIGEMRSILAVFEEHLGTTEGRLTLHPTPLAHHVLTARLSPADIRVISATLENRLSKVGVSIRDFPPHDPRFTLDEAALAKALVDGRKPDTESPRIRHDVDCVAAVLTLRAGRTALAIERSVAIFCSSTGLVVRNVQQWFSTQHEQGVPPIVHQAALTSIAWLKKPAAAPGIKMSELAALCAAAMRPTRETWKKFVDTLRRLRAEGAITDDETAAVVVSELTEPLLARLDDEFEPDADSMQEAVERVREAYRREASGAAQEAVSKALADVGLAQRAASSAIARHNQLVAGIERRVGRQASWVAKVVFVAAIFLTVVAAILSLPGVFEAVGGLAKWAARGVLAAAAAFGVYSAVRGSSLSDLRASLEERVARSLRGGWMAETETVTELPSGSVPRELSPRSDGAVQQGDGADERRPG